MSLDNAQSAVTYTSISSDSDGPSWGIPLMNVGEFPEMDPYEEVAQQGQHPEYHAPSDDEIQVKDDDEDPEEDPNEMHEPEDDDEDPNEEHELEDEDTREPSEDSDETKPFKEDETTVTPPPPRHHRARISVRPRTPMAVSTQALIDAFAAGSSLFPLPPTSPAYDQAPLGHRVAMTRKRDDIPEEDMPPQRRFAFTAPPLRCDIAKSSATARAPRSQHDFVDTVEAGQGLIRSPSHDAWTIARAADIAEDVGYVRDLQASECRMMTSIKEVNLRVTYQAQVRRQESKYFYTQLHDAQTDRRDIRLEIDVVRSQRTAYATELHEVHQAYLSFEARNRALLARPEILETHMSRMEWQRQSVEDLAVTQMMRIHTLEARARTDTVEDADSNYLIPFNRPTIVEVPSELPKVSMAVDQHHLESKTFGFQNERLLEQVISKDIVNIVVNASVNALLNNAFVSMSESLKEELRKLKRKAVVENAITSPIIAQKMCEIDVQPIASRLLHNRIVHYEYLRSTKEQAATLKDIVEQGKSKNPVNSFLDYACKYTKRIQELLILIRQTCLSINKSSASLVAMNPKNKDKKVRFSESATSSRNKNTKLASSSNIVSNKPLLSFTGVNTTTSASGSQHITFTIVGNACPLTRITKTTEVPLRKLIALENDTHKPVVTLVYSWKPRRSKTSVPASKSKINKSMTANNNEPSKSKESKVSNIPSSSIDECKSSKLFFARQSLVRGLPKLKFEKDHLCSACTMGKSTKKTHKPKSEDTNQEKLYLLHMDLCGPMRVARFNEKKSDWDILFQPLFVELLNPPPGVDLPAAEVVALIPEVAAPELAVSTGSPIPTTGNKYAPC
nr:ribonuclease H-like domain-containing protein [Tanacetum cinerariifolium]